MDIIFCDNPTSIEKDFITKGLNEHSVEHTGFVKKSLSFLMKDGSDMPIAGLMATTMGCHINIKLLYVDPDHRGKGYAKKLMSAAENYAISNDFIKCFVDTLSYQAPEFYEKLGYQEITRIEKFYPNHDRIFYTKTL